MVFATRFLFQRARDEYRDWAKKAKQPMSRALLRRFIEAQAKLIAPICPHWAEYVWSILPGTSGTVTAAGWPVSEPVDQVRPPPTHTRARARARARALCAHA